MREVVFEDRKLNCKKNAWPLLYSTICFCALISFGSIGFAQAPGGGAVDGGDGGGGGGGGVATPSDQNSNVTTGDGAVDPATDQVDIEISENERNQGFVGATSANIAGTEEGFVGAVSEQSGPPLDDNASFGGGVNDVAPTIPGGANGENNSFTVTRRSIRARLRPNFYAPVNSGEDVSNRFQNHFSRQPGSQLSGSSYNITVNNRTAYIRGSVNTPADSERLERQLRLEPGVYRIVNELSISR